MCDYDQIKRIEEEKFKVSLENRKFEVELFWKRSLFFWGFIASAFIAFANLQKDQSDSDYAILVGNFGMVCSFAWTLANRGSKYWQDNWEQKLFGCENYIEEGFFSKPIGTQDEHLPYHKKRFSVSKLTIALSDFTVVIWSIIVFIKLFDSLMCIKTLNILLSIISILSFIYMIYMACNCQGKDKE